MNINCLGGEWLIGKIKQANISLVSGFIYLVYNVKTKIYKLSDINYNIIKLFITSSLFSNIDKH